MKALEWFDDALCAQTDPDLFVSMSQGESPMQAKKVCAACPVAGQCLDYAMTNHIVDGIYGGMTPRQRRTMRRSAA